MTTTINIRTDKDVKIACEALYKKLGLNLSTAINTFLKASLRHNGLPFELVDEQADFNSTTLASINEGKNKKLKSYSSIKEFRDSLGV